MGMRIYYLQYLMYMSRAEQLADRIDGIMEMGGWRKDAICIAVSAVCLVLSFLDIRFSFLDPAWIAVLLCGLPISVDAITGLLLRHDIKADVVVFIALVAAIWIGDIITAGEVATIMQIGGMLESLTSEKSRKGINRLMSLAPMTANLIDGDHERTVPVSEIVTGDKLRVRPGESVPADGTIMSGSTSIDQSSITGESIPAERTAGDSVYGGTINMWGAFDMIATRDGNDSAIQRMARMMESADVSKSKVVGIADRFATWIVALIIVIAGSVYFLTGDVTRTVAVLVVFCPCAFVLAVPTAIVAAIGNASKHGFLVKDGGSLERLSKVDSIVLDKTGTLTYGSLTVDSVKAAKGHDNMEVLRLAAAAESLSEHPIGKAIVESCRRIGYDVPVPESGNIVPGKGIETVMDGKTLIVGNAAMMSEKGIEVPNTDSATTVYVLYDDEYLGSLTLSDTVREESREAIFALKNLSVTPVLATGDTKAVAEKVGVQLGIKEIHPSCLPEDKLEIIRSYDNVCMVGDGVNDSPSLKTADVGISMGGIGSDIAIEASDIVVVNDGISGVPGLISLSRKMMSKIRLNIAVAMCINVVAVSLAVAGMLTPFAGALVHNVGSVFVVVNSALILGWRWYPRPKRVSPPTDIGRVPPQITDEPCL